MLFTWDTANLCVVFRSWRVTGAISLIFTILGVVALTAGYEAVREVSRRSDDRLARRIERMTRNDPVVQAPLPLHCMLARFGACADLCEANTDRSSLLRTENVVHMEMKDRLIKAAFYGIQVFYSFFIM